MVTVESTVVHQSQDGVRFYPNFRLSPTRVSKCSRDSVGGRYRQVNGDEGTRGLYGPS